MHVARHQKAVAMHAIQSTRHLLAPQLAVIMRAWGRALPTASNDDAPVFGSTRWTCIHSISISQGRVSIHMIVSSCAKNLQRQRDDIYSAPSVGAFCFSEGKMWESLQQRLL